MADMTIGGGAIRGITANGTITTHGFMAVGTARGGITAGIPITTIIGQRFHTIVPIMA